MQVIAVTWASTSVFCGREGADTALIRSCAIDSLCASVVQPFAAENVVHDVNAVQTSDGQLACYLCCYPLVTRGWQSSTAAVCTVGDLVGIMSYYAQFHSCLCCQYMAVLPHNFLPHSPTPSLATPLLLHPEAPSCTALPTGSSLSQQLSHG